MNIDIVQSYTLSQVDHNFGSKIYITIHVHAEGFIINPALDKPQRAQKTWLSFE